MDLEKARSDKLLAEQNMESMHKTMLAATEETAFLKNRLGEIQNSERVFEIFSKQVHEWRSLASTVARVVRQHSIIDPHTETVCRETARRLEQIAESLNDNRASPGRAQPTGLLAANLNA